MNKDDKSSLLNVKLEDRMITSQIGDKGPQSYVETLGPSRMGNRTAIPYQKALPKYEKSAESALQKSDIPPRLRGKSARLLRLAAEMKSECSGVRC